MAITLVSPAANNIFSMYMPCVVSLTTNKYTETNYYCQVKITYGANYSTRRIQPDSTGSMEIDIAEMIRGLITSDLKSSGSDVFAITMKTHEFWSGSSESESGATNYYAMPAKTALTGFLIDGTTEGQFLLNTGAKWYPTLSEALYYATKNEGFSSEYHKQENRTINGSATTSPSDVSVSVGDYNLFAFVPDAPGTSVYYMLLQVTGTGGGGVLCQKLISVDWDCKEYSHKVKFLNKFGVFEVFAFNSYSEPVVNIEDGEILDVIATSVQQSEVRNYDSLDVVFECNISQIEVLRDMVTSNFVYLTVPSEITFMSSSALVMIEPGSLKIAKLGDKTIEVSMTFRFPSNYYQTA